MDAYGGLEVQIWVSVVSVSRPSGLEAMLKIDVEGPNENFDNINEDAIPL